MTLMIPDDATARLCIASFFNDQSAVDKILEHQGDKGYGTCARIALQALAHRLEINRTVTGTLNEAARALIDIMGADNPEAAPYLKDMRDRERQLRLDELNRQQIIEACRRLDIAL
jgi:hypothetical protein